MKPVTVAECDPELDAALEVLRNVVPSYRAARRKFLYIYSDPDRYRELAPAREDVSRFLDEIRSHAERCNLKVDALIEIVDATALNGWIIKARDIVADLPKPVDPAAAAVERLLSDYADGFATTADEMLATELARKAFALGRELAAPEVSHVG